MVRRDKRPDNERKHEERIRIEERNGPEDPEGEASTGSETSEDC